MFKIETTNILYLLENLKCKNNHRYNFSKSVSRSDVYTVFERGYEGQVH